MAKATGKAARINPLLTAIIFIEYQNDYTTEGGALYDTVKECMEATGTLQNSKELMEAAREAGVTVIHMPMVYDKGHNCISRDSFGILADFKENEYFKKDTWGAEICDLMKPLEEDIIVKGKSGPCGFHSTNLEFILRQLGVRNLILAGFLTNICVESTMRNAYERGFKVYTAKNCCAATSIAAQEAAYEHTFGSFSHCMSSEEIIEALNTRL